VRLRVDDQEVTIDGPAWPAQRQEQSIMAEITLGEKRLDQTDPGLAQAVTEHIAVLKADADKERADAATHKAQADALRKKMDECKAAYDAEMAGLRAQHEEMSGKLAESEKKKAEAEANSRGDAAEAAFRARFDARVRLLGVAGKLGVEKADELDETGLLKAIVRADDGEIKVDDQSPEYLRAYVDVVSRRVQKADASHTDAARAAAGLGTDGKPKAPASADKLRADALAEYMKSTFGVEA